jgi:hypothetical protein
MAEAVQTPLARNAASARALLAALERHAASTADLIGEDTAADFFAAMDERDQLFTQLSQVVDAVVQARVIGSRERAAHAFLVQQIAQEVATTLESHERLVARAQVERDRLAGAVERSMRPDTVARQYGHAGRRRSAVLSVTG